MREKHFWLCWGGYASVVVAINILLAILFPHAVKADIYMIFQFVFLVCMLYRGWRYHVVNVENNLPNDINAQKQLSRPTRWTLLHLIFIQKIEAIVCLYTAPLMIPFALFLVGPATIFISFPFLFVPFIVANIAATIRNYIKDKKQQKEVLKAQEQQQRREELGRWT